MSPLHTKHFLTLLLIFWFSLTSLYSCHQEVIRVSQTTSIRETVTRFSRDFPDLLKDLTPPIAPNEIIKEELGDPHVPVVFKNLSELQTEVVREHYQESGYTPLFFPDLTLTEQGLDLWKLIRKIASHGLDPVPYRPREIAREFLILGVLKVEYALSGSVVLSDSEREKIIAHLLLHSPSPNDISPDSTLLFNQFMTTHSSQKARQLGRYQAIQQQVVKHTAYLDILLACALVRYADEMRYAHFHRYSQPNIHSIKQNKGFKELQRNELRGIVKSVQNNQFYSRLASLAPNHIQYNQLRVQHIRYQGFIDQGGWETVEKRGKLKFGQRSKLAKKLKIRLAKEEYFYFDSEDEPDDLYDQDLKDAILLYQSTHQLKQTKNPNKYFYRSLNISAQRRLEQIELNLERWRNSRIQNDNLLVFVNIPLYMGQVLQKGSDIHSFRVVVGNTKRIYDEDLRKQVMKNKTPIIRSQIEKIIYNPYWNVPKRIRFEELEPNLDENPFWYEDHNYEIVNEGKEWEYVRQLPGRGNALGRVKLIFPNPYDIYLHDTPAKKLFKNTIRSYSHGCVRVQDPLDLAQVLLELDGQWNQRKVKSILRSMEQTELYLKTSIPIVIEYFTVWVKDDRAIFLTDIYKYDKNREEELSYK